MVSDPSTIFRRLKITAAVFCALLLAGLCSGAPPSAAADYEEDDRVHDFLRALDQAARYRRECFGECAKGCYYADNPYTCLRECMPTPPTRSCGATYGAVQGVFSSAATFASTSRPEREDGGAGSGEGFVSRPT